MVPSVAGAIVCVALLMVGWFAGGAHSSSVVCLTSLWGDSHCFCWRLQPSFIRFLRPLILKVMLRGNFLGSLYSTAQAHPSIIIAGFLAVYALGGTIIIPRLLAGETTVFVPVDGIVRELSLAPSGGNINQTAYFVMGIAVFAFMTVYLSETRKQDVIRSCLFSFAIANTLLGVVDLAGKLVGGGDVLAFIRTASYAMLSEEEIGGFSRITGGCSEASGYAATSLASLGFTFAYWRNSGSPLALGLTVCTLVLLVFSTSTTAYVGLGLLATLAAVSIVGPLITADFYVRDILILLTILAVLTIALGLYLYNPDIFDH